MNIQVLKPLENTSHQKVMLLLEFDSEQSRKVNTISTSQQQLLWHASVA